MIRRDSQAKTYRNGKRGGGSNITPGHVRAFHMITSRLYEDNISLCNCTVDGEPGVAIVLMDRVSETQVAVMPLFVAITPAMRLEIEGVGDDEGEEAGGGPVRSEVIREFEANKDILTPGGGA
jgi:hypothetical protein